jgi:L-seryl-tRNA(Ser) seleniumtransferase
MPSERLAAGADLVTFSGDKLVGGPQAGLIVGRADPVARLRRDPLARAMRPDKVTLVAVAATLALYRAGRARSDIPVWRAIAADADDLRHRADRISSRLAPSGSAARIDVVATRATVGGGSLPGETLPSVALRVHHGSASRLAERLRRSDPCVIGRIEDGAVLLDLRTVDPVTDEALVAAVGQAIGSADATRRR